MKPRLGAADAEALRATCLHEYAHLAVARHFGACGFVVVQRARSADSSGASWHGRFQLFGALADDEWRIVAIAGAFAECIANGDALDAALLERSLRRPGTLSPCDAALACGYDIDDVQRCIAIVRGAWTDICSDAGEHAAEILRDYALDASPAEASSASRNRL